MIYRKIKDTDLNAAAIALGTDVYGSVVSKEDSEELLNTYVELGGNIIDTAKIYADWYPGEKSRSEKLIGNWMQNKKNRDKLIISTKGGHPPRENMSLSRLSKKELTFDIEASLRHLKTDYIDIYWLHRDDKAILACEIAETLNEFLKSGKARYIGLSNWSCERVSEMKKYCPVIASQIQYSLAEPNYENNDPTLEIMNEKEYEYYKKSGLCVFAFASQAKGFFSKMDKGGVDALSEKARERYLNEKSLETYKKIKKLSIETGYTVGELVTGLLVNNSDFHTIPIVGCKNTVQLKESMAGGSIKGIKL